MPFIKKTLTNPHGLSTKQILVIEDATNQLAETGKINLPKAVAKFYTTNHPKAPTNIASKNMAQVDFRQAMLESMQKKGIVGKNGKVEQRLAEGLDAVATTQAGDEVVDFSNRLRYAQEINKITGVYAPEKHQTERLSLNVNISEEEANKRIGKYFKELEIQEAIVE